MKAKGYYRRGVRERRQKRSWIPVALVVVGGVLLVGAAVAYVAAPPAVVSAEYDPEDVVYDRPIVAVHDMNEGPPIPFLPRNQAQPRIEAPEKFFNFGTIGPYDVVEREFILRNTGDAPLTISRAYTTCGCTTAEISASVIPPGKVATIKLVFDAGFHDAAGQTVRRGLIIENNDPQRSQTEIWIQASVRAN